MSWIAEYDTRGREFPTCVHVTKTTGFMTHGTTYVPIEDGKAVRDENARLREVVADGELHAREILAENAKLRELVKDLNKWLWNGADCTECPFTAKCDLNAAFESDLRSNICIGWSEIHDRMRELGVEVEG